VVSAPALCSGGPGLKSRTVVGYVFLGPKANSEIETENSPRPLPFMAFLICIQLSSPSSRDSSDDTATDYGLDDRMIGVRYQAEAGNFSHHRAQIGSRTHPASYPMGTWGSPQR